VSNFNNITAGGIIRLTKNFQIA